MAKEAQKDAKAAENAENKAGVMQASKEGSKAAKEPAYPAGEFVANAREIFGTRQECVAAALKTAGKPEYTLPEAKGIVEKFLKREVK